MAPGTSAQLASFAHVNGSGHGASSSPPPGAEAAEETAVAAGEEGVEKVQAGGYLAFLQKFRSVWPEQPDVHISYSNLSYSVQVPLTDTKVHNLVSTVVDLAKKPFQGSASHTTLHALRPTTGLIRPGSMTLVLGPPGHGKTTLLKALSGRLSHDKDLKGSVKFNNLTAEENMARGLHVSRLCAYVGQQDLLFPVLTVSETLRFAARSSLPDARLLLQSREGEPELSAEQRAAMDEVVELDAQRADLLIQMLGLSECRNTIVGNNLLRGVSGGQRKRVGLGEMLLTNARAFFLDEVSTGLDAAVTLHIFSALKQACAINNSSVVTALLQPTPETYGLFDDIILLKDGYTVYHGPRDDIPKWLWEVAGLEVPSGVDEAGFLVDFLSDPAHQYDLATKAMEALADKYENGVVPSAAEHSQMRASAPLKQSPMNAVAPVVVPAAVPLRSHTPSHVRIHYESEEGTAEDLTLVKVQPQQQLQQPQEIPATQVQPQVDAPVRSPVSAAAPLVASPNLEKPKGLRSFASSSFQATYHSTAAGSPVYDSEELHARYHASPLSVAMATEVALAEKSVKPLDPASWGPYTHAQYGQRYPHSTLKHTSLNLHRQAQLISRDRTMVPPRIAQAALTGAIFGSLFISLGYDKYADKAGLLLAVIMSGAFSNLTELPVAAEARNVVAKQMDAGFFPAFSYSFSVAALHVPLVVAEILINGSMMYWIPGFYASAGNFFFFLFVLFLNSSAMSVFFRSISYLAKNPDVARQMDLPFIIISIIFGGFMIPYSKVPDWLIWLYYLSPFSWGVRSLALNEFKSDKYDRITDPSTETDRDGDVFLRQFDFFTDNVWKWMGPLYLAGFYIIFLAFNAFLLNRLKPITPQGTRKTVSKKKGIATGQRNSSYPDGSDVMHGQSTYGGAADALGSGTLNSGAGAAANTASGAQAPHQQVSADDAMVDDDTPSPRAAANGVPNGEGGVAIKVAGRKGLNNKTQSFQLSALPFVPVTLAWRNISYSVDVVDAKTKVKSRRQLLDDISGYASPGKMTALMGSSGAGKTTLMDVIAGRKTMGYITGDILVNGHPKDSRSFDKLTGYVEQQDIHIGTATVREALLFSAKMRLPTSVTREARELFVDEVMTLVGLSHIAGRLVGDEALPGLSQGQLKLVTIAVELVANPSVVFLDEPTSGLDAPSAARVMKAVSRIAATGRTVLCTIHQPSEELFFLFDRLLLLKSGGKDVYQAEMGRKGRKLVDYFEEASGYTQLLPKGSTEILPNGKKKLILRQSPANWMLDVIGAAGQQSASEAQIDYAAAWRSSKLYAETEQEILEASTPRPNSKPIVLTDTYPSTWARYLEVQRRQYVSHWRNAPMNLTRFLLLLVFSILLGLVYLQMDASDFGGVTSLISVMFLGVSFPSSICAGSALPTFFRQRAAYYRETTIGLYGYKSFSTAIFLTELPYLALCVFVFLTPWYFMIGFANDAELFFQFYLCNLLMCLLYSALSHLWLSLLPNLIAANVANGLVMNLFFMFGGLFIKPRTIPIGWKWMFYVDPIPKAFLGVAMGQFYCDTEAPGNSCPMIKPGPGEPMQYTYDFVAHEYESSKDEFAENVGWLILSIAVIRILVLLALKYVSHIKR